MTFQDAGLVFSPCIVVALLTGCPADDVGVEVGETGDTEGPSPAPDDPFGGEGNDPPGDPDPNADWVPAGSLGNGLVHDSRYDLDSNPRTVIASGQELADGVDWVTFVNEHQAKLAVGFRPTQVQGRINLTPVGGGNFELEVTDWSVYVSDDDANYRTETKTYIFRTPSDERSLEALMPGSFGVARPTSIDTFSIPGEPPPVGVTIAWTFDDNPVPWRVVVARAQDEFEQIAEDMRDGGYRPISLSSRFRDGQLEYAAIFIADGSPKDSWRLDLGLDDLSDAFSDGWADNYYPTQRSYAQGSDDNPRHNLLWVTRPPGLKVQVRTNLDQSVFEKQDELRRTQGYHLESANAYVEDGQVRHQGIWVQFEPYMRWWGTAWNEQDLVYIARYQPFHTQTMQTMTFAGEDKEGDVYRLAATLHIFEGGNLVISRAYTYGPAIYPDTPENAKMPVASVSKSITAAAVVREMAIQGLPLSTPFSVATGINNVPAIATIPTVLDVLRNLGGFAATDPDSYQDHGLIDASPWGDYPISGQEMLDYMVQGNKIDALGSDSYWVQMAYNDSQAAGTMQYSNTGYTMLGELVRVQSSVNYEQYVIDNLLVPLNLVGDIYPDRAHRYADDRTTSAALRSYLSMEGHAYRWGLMPVPPVSGSGSVPKPLAPGFDDGSPRWDINSGPLDPNAPDYAARTRYAGKKFMGGAPLAAGGWVGNGEALGILIRVLNRSSLLMPASVAAQLWAPIWWNQNQIKAPGWSYVLGWYARGNWVAMGGGAAGGSALVLHNRFYDFTVVYLTNGMGQPFGDFIDPLLFSANLAWTLPNGTPQSILGGQFPCQDDPATLQFECAPFPGTFY